MESILGSVLQGEAEKKAAESQRKAQAENERRAAADRAFILNLANTTPGQLNTGIFGEGASNLGYRIGADIGSAWDAVNDYYGSPSNRIANLSRIAGESEGARQGAQRTVSDLFSGNLTTQRLASAAPIFAARTNVAGTQRQGIQTARLDRLAKIEADQARRGYSGSGSAEQTAALRATIPFEQAAAGVGAQAELENAMQRAGIEDEVRGAQLSNINLPVYMAQQSQSLYDLPAMSAYAPYNAVNQALDPYRVQIPWSAIPRTPPRIATPSNSQINLGTGAKAADAVAELALSYASMGCWVARTVYGADNPRWLEFRAWLWSHAPKWFLKLYLRFGERFAEFIHDKPLIKGAIRSWMERCLKSEAVKGAH